MAQPPCAQKDLDGEQPPESATVRAGAATDDPAEPGVIHDNLFTARAGAPTRAGRTGELQPVGLAVAVGYKGKLGTDLWRLGQAWGDLVARGWVDVVRDSMAAIKTESERRAQG
jgi:hypothetical protein